ncbi:MAG: hypothetical protein DSY83_00810, partial [Flavobacteriia bacterium]
QYQKNVAEKVYLMEASTEEGRSASELELARLTWRCRRGMLELDLLLQPFVENSIWHGLSTRNGKKKLSIKVEGTDPSESLRITIADNGIGRQASQAKNNQNPLKGQSLGLSIIKDRLDFFSKKYMGDFNFIIHDLMDEKSGKPLGTKVVIQMPKLMPESR